MLLDDHVVKSQAMAASPFSKPFEERLVPWERKLRRFHVGTSAHVLVTLESPTGRQIACTLTCACGYYAASAPLDVLFVPHVVAACRRCLMNG
jgi:hypothetical protein